MKINILLLSLVFTFFLGVSAMASESMVEPQDIAGHWEGSIDLGGRQLKIKTDFHNQSGKLTGTIDIPEQNATKLPLSNLSYQPPRVYFELMAGTKAVFAGERNADSITGTFTQGNFKGEFTLKRVATELSVTPVPEPVPLVGTEEEAKLKITSGTLYGTLQLPPVKGKCPVVLIIAGSGPTDRDGNSAVLAGANNSLKLIGRELAEAGYASLRYDKRGIAQSVAAAGKEADLRFDDYIQDAVAWLGQLRKDSRFSKVLILGHSEGSLIGMVATRLGRVDGFISVAGPGRPLDQILMEQLQGQLRGTRDDLLQESGAIIQKLKAGQTVAKVSPELTMLFRPSVQPYLISQFRYDPAVEIAKLKVPVLIVHGKTDLQVKVEEAGLLSKAKPDAKLVIIDEMNHVLKQAPADRAANMATYSDPSLPLAPGFGEAVTGFLEGIGQ